MKTQLQQQHQHHDNTAVKAHLAILALQAVVAVPAAKQVVRHQPQRGDHLWVDIGRQTDQALAPKNTARWLAAAPPPAWLQAHVCCGHPLTGRAHAGTNQGQANEAQQRMQVSRRPP